MTKPSIPYEDRKPYFEIRLTFDTVKERDQYKEEFAQLIKKAGYKTGREFLRDKIRELKGQ